MDTSLSYIIEQEYHRQQHELEMIASENYVSTAVMDAYANVFTNKYSEGYPGKRYYGGQAWVDALERLCQRRALKIFDLIDTDEPDIRTATGYENMQANLKTAERAVNVQPLSGSPANIAVYLGCLEPGATILGMDLGAGGHLTHGHPLNASGVYYDIKAYGVDRETQRIDREDLRNQALTHQPALILAGFSAYARIIERARFTEICDLVEQEHGYRPLLMVDMAHVAGLIAGGVYPDPFPHADIVTTTTHKTLRGPRGGLVYMRKGVLLRNGKKMNLVKRINRGVFPGMQGGPHEHIIAAKAVAFAEIIHGVKNGDQMSPGMDLSWKAYAQKVVATCQHLAQGLQDRGWSIVSGGTDNHLLMVDITHKHGKDSGLDGKTAEKALEDVGISCNKNMIPFDTRSPMNPSGLRLGTAAITSRGLGLTDIDVLVEVIDQALSHHDDAAKLTSLKEQVETLCTQFPLWY